jgi:twitching motility two-component system response regulator PilH
MAHILIVEDSNTERHIYKNMLEKHGFTAIVAESGEEGIEKAKQAKPDLVLMDVVMPGLDGFRATRRLVRDPQTAEIPVIIVSTKDQETDRIWGMRQGARDYLTKPVDENDLIKRINSALSG